MFVTQKLTECLHCFRVVSAKGHTNLLDVEETESVCEAGSLFPSGDDDDGIAHLDEVAVFAEVNTVLHAGVDVLQPVSLTVGCRKKHVIYVK